jgi:CO/xanthine dehydrogenase FAD-binding subunit
MYLQLEEYHRPQGLEACLELLSEPGSQLIAGGTFLNRRSQPKIRSLVDIQALGLDAIDLLDGDHVVIGANVRLEALMRSELTVGHSALREAAASEQHVALRNSTLGGRLGRSVSDARIATALNALDATLEIAELGDDGVQLQRVGLNDFYHGALRDPAHLIIAVRLPKDTQQSSYCSFGISATADPLVDVAVSVSARGTRICSGCHGLDARGVLFCKGASDLVDSWGSSPSNDWQAELAETLRKDLPKYSNAYASGEYRRELAITLAIRIFEAQFAQEG